MTAQAAQNLSSAKFPRAGFGFSSKKRIQAKTAESDEDWYIPYNGPYEAPPELPNRRKARDSWGDPLEPDHEEDMVLDDREIHLRYGGHNDFNSSGRLLEEERTGRRRDRTFSSAIDPGRPNIDANRRSTASARTSQALPSYVSMDTLGGVGESPIPPRRSSQERNRISLAGIFSFNVQPRKHPTPTAASRERTISGKFVRKPSFLQRSDMGTVLNNEKVYSKADAPGRYSSSSEHANPPVKDKHQQLHHAVMLHASGLSSDTTEADYYNSYYATLGHDKRSETLNHHPRSRLSPTHSEDLHGSGQPTLAWSSRARQNSFSSRSAHPYAHAIPRNNMEGSSKTPLIPTLSTFTASSNPNGIEPPRFPFTQHTKPRTPKLKDSTSTPDLRKSAILDHTIVTPGIPIVNFTPQPKATSHFVVKNLCLSAESWYDAVLFPRPRLKTGFLPALGVGSGRIVSEVEPHSTGFREPGVASRVLAHSLSLGDLNSPVGLSSSYTSPHPSRRERDPQTSRAGMQSTALAQEDRAPPTPVPSLTQVLEQGQQLANERMAWQLQARSSFGNRRARSLVKVRSKSSAQFGRRRGHQVQTSMDYLAAQACLGSQNLAELPASNTSHSRTGSQSQTTSLSKSLSKSSKSHSRNHSRNDSCSKSAAKVAMSTVAICGFSSLEDEVTVLREGDVRGASLEGALRGDGTRIIRLADPVHIPIERGHPINLSLHSSTRLTPSPSNGSDHEVGVGIAVGTPPPEDDQGDLFYHPSHPYARGGLSFSNPSHTFRTDRGADFAGPHPSVNSDDISQISDTLARYKLPPHLRQHPYAQGSARDSYLDHNGLVAQYRSGSETPHSMKMWTQLSPGILREVLPDDFQYSPLIPQKENNISPMTGTRSRDSLQINDIIGVGETLVNAANFRAGPATDVMPMSHVDGDKQHVLPEFGPRTIRQPIEHDLALFEDSEALSKLSLTNRVVSTSPGQHSPPPLSDRAASTSSSSPPLTPHRLGSPNDLEDFRDLFYRPNNELRRTLSPDNPSSAYISPTLEKPKTESSLTSLARQLSDEFEQVSREGERSNSQHSSVLSSTRQLSGGVSSRPTAASLEFVFEEASQLELGAELPQDVESSRRSSVIERADDSDAEDDTAVLRVGVIESILTPASVSSLHRPDPYVGKASEPPSNEGRQQDRPVLFSTVGTSGEARAQILSSLHPSSITRSSYMTTSTVSRMSGLSDFPSPPKDHHMSLGTYFDEPLGDIPPSDQEMCFGRNQNAGDLAKTLSSSS